MEDYFYSTEDYARTLEYWGRPLFLKRSQAWVLERSVRSTSTMELTNCFPMFRCDDLEKLEQDLSGLSSEYATFTIITDPFGVNEPSRLKEVFREHVTPFKRHFIRDLTAQDVSKHHRYYAKKARSELQIERCESPLEYLDIAYRLYDESIKKWGVTDVRNCSLEVFRQQLLLPGASLFRASKDGETLSIHLWYQRGDVVYSHLAASSEHGYKLNSSYGVYSTAIEYYSSRASWINFGAGTYGFPDAEGKEDGITRFKKGWSTETRIVHLCGRIINPVIYGQLCERFPRTADSFVFPPYRSKKE